MIFGRCKALRRPYSQAALRFLHLKPDSDKIPTIRSMPAPKRAAEAPAPAALLGPARGAAIRLALPRRELHRAWKASAYASAPAPAASARRRSRPRSASASRARASGCSCSRSTPRGAWRARSACGAPGEPARVEPRAPRCGRVQTRGELWAMTLDVKQTFDELIVELAPDEHSREELLSNRIYRELSSAAAGSQEVAAVAKLFELDRERSFDVVVVDTPPSHNALDFLEAPARLTSFLEGRAMDIFTLGAGRGGLAARVCSAVGRRCCSASSHAPPASSSPGDLALLPTALGPARGLARTGRERRRAAPRRGHELSDRHARRSTGPREEAAFLHRSLLDAGLPYGALVVNRVHEGAFAERRARGASRNAGRSVDARLGAGVMRSVTEFEVLASRDSRDACAPLGGARGALALSVPELGEEVDDLRRARAGRRAPASLTRYANRACRSAAADRRRFRRRPASGLGPSRIGARTGAGGAGGARRRAATPPPRPPTTLVAPAAARARLGVSTTARRAGARPRARRDRRRDDRR